ncbi:MAG: glycosyl hydrolase [Paludibacter sp.]
MIRVQFLQIFKCLLSKSPLWGVGGLLLLSISVFSQSSLYENFKNPPAEAKPWTFWYWMHGAVSKEGIRADLKAMHEIGLGGAYLMPIRGVEGSTYSHRVNQLTPEWWEMVRYSFQIADSLGLKMGMHISDGFALAGGPWIKPVESMQKVVFTDTIIKGGKIVNLQLRQPETIQNYYEDIAVYAIPLSEVPYRGFRGNISSNNPDDSIPFSIPNKDFKATNPCYIQYTFEKPFTLRTIEITPIGNNIQSQRLAVSASDDGINFRLIKQLVPPRQGWQNTGFNTTFSIPATKAKYFRLSWTPEGSEPGSEELDAAKWKPTLKIKAIRLSSEARINGWEGKAGLVWRIANETTAQEISVKECVPMNKVLNLTAYFKDGNLTCKLPRGNWRIVRMGHTSTGLTNATAGGGKGLECDKFSEKSVQKQFDNWFGAAFSKTDSALAHRVLKFMHIDSWECGSQNWSSNFAAEFQSRRGYELMPYLPLLAGFPIESVKKSEQVLRDVRTTIAELVNDVFFTVMQKNAKAYGCETSAECVAPTMVSDGMLHFKTVDRPMGEFWLKSPTHDKPNDMLDAISGAHIYGKNIIQSESFTQLRTNWDEDPAMLKPVLDRNFALGINKLFFHVFVHNPYTDKAPGTTLDGIGTYFQRDQSWWKPGKAFVDYVARCQALLQYGHPVTDLAVFSGEEIPRRALTPDKLVTILPGIVGKERVESEQKRLANTGQPMCEMPAGVNHSANILKAEDWINPLNGYTYDSFNKDALLHLAKARNGGMQLGDSTIYKAVIFPKGSYTSAETIAKTEELKRAGVAVFDAGLKGSPGFEPDVRVPANIAWTHRSGEIGDIYFISNQENVTRNFNVIFRNAKNKPTQWNPVTGQIELITKIERTDTNTKINITLDPYESTFIVFSYKNEAENKYTLLLEDSIPINNKWSVTFKKNNQTVNSTDLFDWSLNLNPLIKYYSGTAIYRTTFSCKSDYSKQLDKYSRPICLSLGKVFNLATVRLNGINCGTTWTAPYQVDISKALKKGTNTLEIEVTNTWANAINGSDKGTPPFPGIWTNAKYRMKEDKLVEAGLLGPVKIIQK